MHCMHTMGGGGGGIMRKTQQKFSLKFWICAPGIKLILVKFCQTNFAPEVIPKFVS